jgi:uncharacterized protein (UPF0276 family)
MTGADFQAPKLGIGMIFSAALRPFLERRPGALDVLEIEPQTLWLADDAFAGPFYEFRPGIELFAALPQAKLVHSVGMPLGGTRAPSAAQCDLIRETARRLHSPWVSEHLSVAGTPHRAAGFLLPPLQTDEGVATAAANVRAFAQGVGRPVAIETGVAYLARKPFEMDDGAFVAHICDLAGCGILLDLHNLWCNERNGRIRIDRFLSQIPLDRVWEVHLAGGAESEGFWLDSHSGPMPEGLGALSREVLASLPNLGAVNFEIYDTFLERTAPETLDEIVGEMRELWNGAGRAVSDARPAAVAPQRRGRKAPAPGLWESALTEAVWQDAPEKHPYPEDETPLRLYSRLGRSFRGSMIARALPRAIRYLILRERDGIDALMALYYRAVDPRLYAPLEAAAFRDWLAETDRDPLLKALLDYDAAFLAFLRETRPQVVTFPGNPGPVFEALADLRLPACPAPPAWEIEILPDESIDAASFAPAMQGS